MRFINRHPFAAASGAVALLAVVAALALAQPSGPAQVAQPTAAQPSPTALARLAAAERTCKILHDMQTGDPRGHQGVEHTYLWSKRRMEAQIDVERTNPGGGDGGIAAIGRHLEWMQAWHEQVVKSGAFSGFDVASTEFYVAEAEDMLARAKTK